MQTSGYKLYLNQNQQRTIDGWMESLRWVWNEGLGLLKEFDAFSHYDKFSKSQVACCPLPWQYRWTKEQDRWIAIAYTPIAFLKPYRSFCPLNQDWKEPRLTNATAFGLAAYFAHKRHPDKPWLQAIPTSFIRGVTTSLATAWEQYKKKPQRGIPRFKRFGETSSTLINPDSKKINIEGRKVKIPKLGNLHARKLEKWPSEVDICTLKILKKPSGYYLQLTGELPVAPVKPSRKVVAIDVGVQAIYTDERGKSITPPRYQRQQAKCLKRLQRKVERQEKDSKRQQRTRKRIAVINEKVALQRRNLNHKLSSKLVKIFGGIAVENLKVSQLIVKPDKQKSATGTGYDHTGAALAARFNRALTENALGQLLTMIEAKSAVAGRLLVKVEPAYTTSTCSRCGHEQAVSLSEKLFRCEQSTCRYTVYRKTNAAHNIRQRADEALRRIYGECSPEVTRGEDFDPATREVGGDSSSLATQGEALGATLSSSTSERSISFDTLNVLNEGTQSDPNILKAQEILENSKSQVRQPTPKAPTISSPTGDTPKPSKARRSVKKDSSDVSGKEFEPPP